MLHSRCLSNDLADTSSVGWWLSSDAAVFANGFCYIKSTKDITVSYDNLLAQRICLLIIRVAAL